MRETQLVTLSGIGSIHPEERKYGHGYIWRCYCRAQVVRVWRGDCCHTLVWRDDQQGQSLCNAPRLLIVSGPQTLILIGNYTDLGFLTSVETPRHPPLSLKTEVIKKCNRDSSSLAASSRKSLPTTATGATGGIVTAKGRNSTTTTAGLPPLTRPLSPSGTLGNPIELGMKLQ